MPIVLTVEDDEQVRVLAESILKEEGYETLSAADVNEALALLRSEREIDVFFSPTYNWGPTFRADLISRRRLSAFARKSPWSIALDGTSPTGCEHSSSNLPFIYKTLRPSAAHRRCGSLGELVPLIYTTVHGISGVELLDD